jgi:diadenosine tetraphosphate (Ap4A) HIT family hydrolase
MASLFTRIINRELPGRFVYEDEQVVAFLTIAPVRPGHTLVVPRLEVDHWIDLPPDLLAATWAAAQTIGQAIQRAYQPKRVGALLLGLEVPHVHVHLVPIDSEAELDLSLADRDPSAEKMDEAERRIRAALG